MLVLSLPSCPFDQEVSAMSSPSVLPLPPLALVRAFERSRVAAAATAAAYELVWPTLRRPLSAAPRSGGRPEWTGRLTVPELPVAGGSCA